MAEEMLLCSIEGGVAVVTLNRPERLNAISAELGRLYDRRLVDLANDPAVRVIVITGAGRGFCGGADSARLAKLADDGGASLTDPGVSPYASQTAWPPHLRRRYMAAAAAPKPVIAAVNGACAGAGLALAASCDVRFASTGAVFSAIFGRRGLIAESGLAWTLPKLVGRGAAQDMLLSGRKVDAATALRIGLVSEVLAPDGLMDHTLAYARDIAANVSPRSARIIKAQLAAAEAQTLAEALSESDAQVREALLCGDFKEAMAAMGERRPAVFSKA